MTGSAYNIEEIILNKSLAFSESLREARHFCKITILKFYGDILCSFVLDICMQACAMEYHS